MADKSNRWIKFLKENAKSGKSKKELISLYRQQFNIIDNKKKIKKNKNKIDNEELKKMIREEIDRHNVINNIYCGNNGGIPTPNNSPVKNSPPPLLSNVPQPPSSVPPPPLSEPPKSSKKTQEFIPPQKGKATFDDVMRELESKMLKKQKPIDEIEGNGYCGGIQNKFTEKDAKFFLKKIKENIKDYLLLIKIDKIPINEIVNGMNHELEHGLSNEYTNVTNDNFIITGKIALAHLLEDPYYYIKLDKIFGGNITSSIYKNIINKYRRKFCNGKSRDLFDKEYHPLCANFEGPNTRISDPFVRNYPPYNHVDACAKIHDIDYETAGKYTGKEAERRIRDADDRFLECISKYKNEEPYYTIGKLGIETKNKFEDVLPLLSKTLAPSYFGHK
jgi:hypothetical protein